VVLDFIGLGFKDLKRKPS